MKKPPKFEREGGPYVDRLSGYGPTGTLTLQGATRFQVYGYEY